jgi:hypothetical protein
MALASSRGDREQAKFIERADGQTAVAVDLGAGDEINVDASSMSTTGLVGKSSGGDFTTAYQAATGITIGGLPDYHSTFLADDVISVVQVATGGGVTATYHRDDAVFTFAGTTLTVTGATFAASDTFVIYTNIQRRAEGANYTSATQSNRTEEIDPIDQKYVAETLLALTNIAETTTAYGYIDMAGVKYLGIQGETDGTTPTDVLTVTLEATCQDDGTAPASCTYQDVTSALTGVASFVDTDFFVLVDTPLPVKYLRVKYVTSTGGGK